MPFSYLLHIKYSHMGNLVFPIEYYIETTASITAAFLTKTERVMTRFEARHLTNTQGRLHTLVVYFTKLDGSKRRMVCRYNGTISRKPYLMTVWDLEKGDWRSINLDTVSCIKVLGREDRQFVHHERSYEEVKQEIYGLLFN